MKVTINKREFRSFADCAERMLRGDPCYDGIGIVEETQKCAENNSRAIGRLMSYLVSKNILTKDVCVDILENFRYDDNEPAK